MEWDDLRRFFILCGFEGLLVLYFHGVEDLCNGPLARYPMAGRSLYLAGTMGIMAMYLAALWYHERVKDNLGVTLHIQQGRLCYAARRVAGWLRWRVRGPPLMSCDDYLALELIEAQRPAYAGEMRARQLQALLPLKALAHLPRDVIGVIWDKAGLRQQHRRITFLRDQIAGLDSWRCEILSRYQVTVKQAAVWCSRAAAADGGGDGGSGGQLVPPASDSRQQHLRGMQWRLWRRPSATAKLASSSSSSSSNSGGGGGGTSSSGGASSSSSSSSSSMNEQEHQQPCRPENSMGGGASSPCRPITPGAPPHHQPMSPWWCAQHQQLTLRPDATRMLEEGLLLQMY